MRRFASLLVSLLLVPSVARAQTATTPTATPPATPSSPVESSSSWYGGEPLVVDVLSIATMVGGAAVAFDPHNLTLGEGIFALGAGGYLATSPIIHAAHHHSEKAGGAFALRLLLPLALLGLGGEIGALLQHTNASADAEHGGDSTTAFLVGGSIGFFVGAVSAAVIDDTVIAREDRTPATPDQRATITPTFAPIAGGATAGVGGTF
jgi:hypothetical protein